jgi:hypothetical protein
LRFFFALRLNFLLPAFFFSLFFADNFAIGLRFAIRSPQFPYEAQYR